MDVNSGVCESVSAGCTWLYEYSLFAVRTTDSGALIAVFDIDDTLLLEGIDGQLAVNAPVVALFRQCRDLGIQVHVVTARPKTSEQATLRDLHNAGVDGFAKLHMMHDGMTVDDVPAWKERIRWHVWLSNRGPRDNARVLFSIGDQWWDLLGSDKLIDDACQMYGYDDKKTFLLTHTPGMEPAEKLLKLPSLN